LNQLLKTHRSQIVKGWYDQAVHSYPLETGKFLKRQKDQFANPIGVTISQELEKIFDELLLEESTDNLPQSIDAVVRARAVQDFFPSNAVAFFLQIKAVVRHQLGHKIHEQGLSQELVAFEEKVDQMCLLVFDIYMKCREKIWELKAKEAQLRTKNLLRRAKVDWRFPDPESSSGSSSQLT
jgi:hypothetical protein